MISNCGGEVSFLVFRKAIHNGWSIDFQTKIGCLTHYVLLPCNLWKLLNENFRTGGYGGSLIRFSDSSNRQETLEVEGFNSVT